MISGTVSRVGTNPNGPNMFRRACGGMDGCNNDVCSQLLLVSRNKDDSSTVLHSGIKFD